MIRISASDMAMTGFGVVAKRPWLLFWWTLLHIAFIGASSLLTVTIAGPDMTQMMALQSQYAPADPERQAQIFALMGHVLPLYLALFPLMLVFYAVLYAAMNRAVLRPSKSAFGYLRLGVDEWRQFLLFLWVLVVGLGAYIAVLLITAIVVFAGAAVFAAMHKSGYNVAVGTGGTTLGVIGFILLYLAAYAYVLVRLSLASAMTFDTGKVSLLTSWRLTKGRFWTLFGAYVLAVIFSLVVSLLGLVVMLICTMLAGGPGGLAFMFRPDMSSIAVYFSPARLVYLGLGGVLYALVWPIVLMPPAAIYKALTVKPTPASSPSSAPEPDPFCAVPDGPKPL